MTNLQTFEYESNLSIIKQNDDYIVMEIIKNNQVAAEQTFTINKLKEISPIFSMSSIQSIYEELGSLSKRKELIIKESNNHYSVLINIIFKETSTVELIIPKQINAFNNSLFSMKELNNRFDEQLSLINKLNEQLDDQKEIIRKQNEKLNSIENQLDLILNSITSNTAQNQFKQTSNFQICNFVVELCKQPIIKRMNQNSSSIKPIAFLNQEETMMLSNFITTTKSVFYNRLYSPIKGEDTPQICFDSFYNTPSLIVLIKTVKGCRFGGYTSVGWEKPPSDDSSKIFLLTQNR